jgi:predicted nucleic acid-binding protein
VKRVYVDSNVLISLIQDEFGKGNEFMSLRVKQFLDKTLSCAYLLVISDWCIEEVKRITKLSSDSIRGWIDSLENKVELVISGSNDFQSAKNLLQKKAALHWSDALHTAISLNMNCEVLATWNIRDFSSATINAKTPSEL